MSEQLVNPQQNRSNRKIILAIVGIPTLVFILSSILYYLVESRAIDLGTVNNGQLVIPPLQLTELPMRTVAGDRFDYVDHSNNKSEPRWAYVVIGDRYCTGPCERMLYIARQSIVALGKKMSRVRLQFVTVDGDISAELQQRFEAEYRGIDVIALGKESIQPLFAEAKLNAFDDKQFFVVDPNGWLMMYYRVDNTDQETLNTLGKAAVADMRRLIK